MHVATFEQLNIAKFCPKQEIIDVITKSTESIIQHRIYIVLWKRIVSYLEIEIIYLMIDTSYIFVINNTDITIQKDIKILFVTAGTTFE